MHLKVPIHKTKSKLGTCENVERCRAKRTVLVSMSCHVMSLNSKSKSRNTGCVYVESVACFFFFQIRIDQSYEFLLPLLLLAKGGARQQPSEWREERRRGGGGVGWRGERVEGNLNAAQSGRGGR